jgi:hypothetical protein
MTIDELKSPGYVSNGHILRKEAFRALGIAANQHDLTGGEATTGADLKAFFLDCAERCPVKVSPKKESKK